MAKRIAAYVSNTFSSSDEGLRGTTTFLDEGDDDGYDAVDHNYSIEESPNVWLARGVLAQAAEDAQSKIDDYVRTCARAYLTNYSEGLELYCESGRIDMDFLIERWTKLVGHTPFPENYDKLYKKEKKWKRAGKLTQKEQIVQAYEQYTKEGLSSRVHLDGSSGDVRVAEDSASTAG